MRTLFVLMTLPVMTCYELHVFVMVMIGATPLPLDDSRTSGVLLSSGNPVGVNVDGRWPDDGGADISFEVVGVKSIPYFSGMESNLTYWLPFPRDDAYIDWTMVGSPVKNVVNMRVYAKRGESDGLSREFRAELVSEPDARIPALLSMWTLPVLTLSFTIFAFGVRQARRRSEDSTVNRLLMKKTRPGSASYLMTRTDSDRSMASGV